MGWSLWVGRSGPVAVGRLLWVGCCVGWSLWVGRSGSVAVDWLLSVGRCGLVGCWGWLLWVGRWSLWVGCCELVAMGWSLWVGCWGLVAGRCELVAVSWSLWVGRYMGWSLWVGCCVGWSLWVGRSGSVAVGRLLWVACCGSVAVGRSLTVGWLLRVGCCGSGAVGWPLCGLVAVGWLFYWSFVEKTFCEKKEISFSPWLSPAATYFNRSNCEVWVLPRARVYLIGHRILSRVVIMGHVGMAGPELKYGYWNPYWKLFESYDEKVP